MAKGIPNKYQLIMVVVLFALLLAGCSKDELTYPVKVNFSIGINQSSNPQAYINLSQAVVGVGSIGFVGLRQEGGDVHFDTEPGKTHGTYVIRAGESARYVTYFDIPQGVYDLMSWKLTLAEIDDDVYEDEITDSDDYGLLIKGSYGPIGSDSIPVYFLIDPMEVFSCEATDALGATPISIVEGNSYTILLELNPTEAVEGISRDYFDNASISYGDAGEEFILISEEDNVNAYQLFLFRLARTLKATVK